MHPSLLIDHDTDALNVHHTLRRALDTGVVAYVQDTPDDTPFIIEHLTWKCVVSHVPPERVGGLVMCPACGSAGWRPST
jgi:hypothetical protein